MSGGPLQQPARSQGISHPHHHRAMNIQEDVLVQGEGGKSKQTEMIVVVVCMDW